MYQDDPNRNKKIKLSQYEYEQLAVCAFRYGVERHGTQCLGYGVLADTLREHIPDIHHCFLDQWIREIHRQQYIQEIDEQEYEKEYADGWYRLKVHSDDYLRWFKQISEDRGLTPNQELMYNKIKELRELMDTADPLMKRENPYRRVDDTSYLNYFLEACQSEMEKRGYRRIPRD